MLGEVFKARPFLVIAPMGPFEEMQPHVTLIPFTSKERRYRYRYEVQPSDENGLTRNSWASCDQFITAKRTDLTSRLGLIEVDHWHTIREFIHEYLGF